MIYYGSYYEEQGFDSNLIIPRFNNKVDDFEYSVPPHYRIVLVNNVDNSIVIWDNKIDEGVEQESKSPFYYKFSSLYVGELNNGEYTITVSEDDELVYKGLLTFRRSGPVDSSIFENDIEYIQFEN